MESKEILDLKKLIDFKHYNYKIVLSLLLLIAGILFYLYWGLKYSVWTDIGIYSITAVLVLGGLFGLILSLLGEKSEE